MYCDCKGFDGKVWCSFQRDFCGETMLSHAQIVFENRGHRVGCRGPLFGPAIRAFWLKYGEGSQFSFGMGVCLFVPRSLWMCVCFALLLTAQMKRLCGGRGEKTCCCGGLPVLRIFKASVGVACF